LKIFRDYFKGKSSYSELEKKFTCPDHAELSKKPQSTPNLGPNQKLDSYE